MSIDPPPGDSEKSYRQSPYRSIKHSTYFPVYDALLSKYRNRPVTFVEIGILEGGSLFMWRDFLGPEARIIGVDLNPNAKKWEKDGFEIFIGSQSSPDFWNDFFGQVGDIDVLLDDGGHTYVQQIVTCEMCFERIRDGGVLIVEDTHTSYMDGFGDRKSSFVTYTKSWTDRLNARFGRFAREQADDRVWSVEIFESIVAFKIDRRFSRIASKPTSNEGARDFSKDFRYGDVELVRDNQEKVDAIMQSAFRISR